MTRAGRWAGTVLTVALAAPASAAASTSVRLSSNAHGSPTCSLSVDGAAVGQVSPDGAARMLLGARVALTASPGRYRISFACARHAGQVVSVAVGARAPHRSHRDSRKPSAAASLLTGIRFTRVRDRTPTPAQPTPPPHRPLPFTSNPQPPPSPTPPLLLAPNPQPPPPPGANPPLPGPNPQLPVIQDPQIPAAVRTLAQSQWTPWRPRYMNDFRNGQCTDIVAQLRPDIIDRAMLAMLARWDMAGSVGDYPNLDWNATRWDANAASAGMAVAATPRAGSVMVIHTANESLSPGHVAYVNAVNADGSLAVTEEHAPILGQVTHDTIPATQISGKDIDFIY
jgi:CHAP domain